jgi:hypothetical protein
MTEAIRSVHTGKATSHTAAKEMGMLPSISRPTHGEWSALREGKVIWGGAVNHVLGTYLRYCSMKAGGLGETRVGVRYPTCTE